MTGERVSYAGKRVSLRDAQVRPLPVQRPHPPIWIGGSGRKRTLPLAAKFADVWHTWGGPDQLSAMSSYLDDLAAKAGRDPAAITRASSLSLSAPLDEVRRNVEQMQRAGIGYLVCGWPGEGRDAVEAFAAKVLPEFTG